MQKQQFHKVTKDVDAQLKDLASVLPEFTPQAIAYFTGAQMNEKYTPEAIKEMGLTLPLEADAQYKVKTAGVPQAINHYKRMKSAYMQGSWEAVDVYCTPYKKPPAPAPLTDDIPKPKRKYNKKPKVETSTEEVKPKRKYTKKEK